MTREESVSQELIDVAQILDGMHYIGSAEVCRDAAALLSRPTVESITPGHALKALNDFEFMGADDWAVNEPTGVVSSDTAMKQFGCFVRDAVAVALLHTKGGA